MAFIGKTKGIPLLVLVSFPLMAATPYLRGRIISSTSGAPIDSAIPRLLVNGLSSFTLTNGTFVLGSPVSVRQQLTDAGQPILFRDKGALWLRTDLSPCTGFCIADLNGRVVQTVAFDKSAKARLVDISRLVQDRHPGGYILNLEIGKKIAASFKVAVLDGNVLYSSSIPVSSPGAFTTGNNLLATVAAAADSTIVDTLHIWRAGYKAKKVTLSQLVDSLADIALDSMTTMQLAPAPLWDDPIHHGASDPTMFYNYGEKDFWIIYTNRRATNCTSDCPTPDGWVFGTDIGACSSMDGGATWQYRGVESIKGGSTLNWNSDTNTFWAPDIIYNNGMYHLYVAFTPGILATWNESIAGIYHLTSTTNPLNGWSYDTLPPKFVESEIDPCVHYFASDSKWHLWNKSTTVMQSTDLIHWSDSGTVTRGGEGPFVFYWKNYWWMLWDPDKVGLIVYRGTDGWHWTQQSTNILADVGTRTDDNYAGNHAMVVLQGANAYIVYFVGPPTATPECFLQVAPLKDSSGILSVDRNTPFNFVLWPNDSMR